MNKKRRMAVLKHRRNKEKLKERHRAERADKSRVS